MLITLGLQNTNGEAGSEQAWATLGKKATQQQLSTSIGKKHLSSKISVKRSFEDAHKQGAGHSAGNSFKSCVILRIGLERNYCS